MLRTVQPDEIYNLGAQSHVRVSFDVPEYTARRRRSGTVRLLEAIRETGIASRSLLSGVVHRDVRRRRAAAVRDHAVPPAQPLRVRQGLRLLDQPELPRGLRHVRLQRHPVQPRVAAPRRTFVTRKITRAAARIKLGLQDKLFLGNLDAKRDWGFAGDYVEAMWLMLQQDKPDDFVIATGETHTVREFLDVAFGALDLDWKQVRRDRPALLPPGGGRRAARRATQGARVLGWSRR